MKDRAVHDTFLMILTGLAALAAVAVVVAAVLVLSSR